LQNKKQAGTLSKPAMNALLLGAANENQLKKKTPICMKTAVIARARPWMRMLSLMCGVSFRDATLLDFSGLSCFRSTSRRRRAAAAE
jgi:hypothetical protein